MSAQLFGDAYTSTSAAESIRETLRQAGGSIHRPTQQLFAEFQKTPRSPAEQRQIESALNAAGVGVEAADHEGHTVRLFLLPGAHGAANTTGLGRDVPRRPEPPLAAPRRVSPPPVKASSAPPKRWWQRGWVVAILAAAGLLIGVGIGASSGSTTTSTETVTRSRVETQTVPGPVRYRTRVKTVAAEPVAPAAPAASDSSTGGDGANYSGDGIKNIGTVNVPTESVLHWTCAGCGMFTILNDIPNDSDTIDVSSQADSGETVLAAGAYHKVDVMAGGSWTISIQPKG